MQRGRRILAAFSASAAILVSALSACTTTAQTSSAGASSKMAVTSSNSSSNYPAAVSSAATRPGVSPSMPASPSVSSTSRPLQHSASQQLPRRPSPAPTAAAAPAVPALPATAYVDVSVATLWRSPSSPRAVDTPALRKPAAIRSWLSAMTLSQRRDLNGRVDSQLLLGERVVVDRTESSWAHVLVPDQPTPLDARGYPGWIPLAQLSFRAAPTSTQEAVVTVPTAWLYRGATKLYEVSLATRLPVLGLDARAVRSETPDGTEVSVRSTDVAVVSRGAAAFAATGTDVVRTAHLFDGLPYLWGGTSGFGFDCSGFTHLVYAMHGMTIPRDADAQARAGRPVQRSGLQPGDLVFFASKGFVHHVGIYVGNNTMLNSPQTGSVVSLVSLSAQPFADEYAGARRYVH